MSILVLRSIVFVALTFRLDNVLTATGWWHLRLSRCLTQFTAPSLRIVRLWQQLRYCRRMIEANDAFEADSASEGWRNIVCRYPNSGTDHCRTPLVSDSPVQSRQGVLFLFFLGGMGRIASTTHIFWCFSSLTAINGADRWTGRHTHTHHDAQWYFLRDDH